MTAPAAAPSDADAGLIADCREFLRLERLDEELGAEVGRLANALEALLPGDAILPSIVVWRDRGSDSLTSEEQIEAYFARRRVPPDQPALATMIDRLRERYVDDLRIKRAANAEARAVLGLDALDARLAALGHQQGAVYRRIAATAATTPAGLAWKLRALATFARIDEGDYGDELLTSAEADAERLLGETPPAG